VPLIHFTQLYNTNPWNASGIVCQFQNHTLSALFEPGRVVLAQVGDQLRQFSTYAPLASFVDLADRASVTIRASAPGGVEQPQCVGQRRT
jgi:hypothetical protein